MADYENLQQKLVELDLEDIPKDKIQEAKTAVGGFLVDAILSTVAEGRSPVYGDKFQTLNKDYADKQKDGNRLPNLELEGDLLSSIGFKTTKDGVVVGVMDASQRPKADGHNNFSGESKLPLRRFIPAENEQFDSAIQNTIEEILDEYRVRPVEITERETTEGEPLSVTLSDILNEESLVNALLRRING